MIAALLPLAERIADDNAAAGGSAWCVHARRDKSWR
jgi:hypothetical protein